MTDLVASKRNMDEHYAPGVFAFSPNTGEECSANPGDYFYLGPDDVLRDIEGWPMVLARKSTAITPLSS